MNGAFQPFRLIKKRATGILYVAMPDLLEYYHKMRNECATLKEEQMWCDLIENFSRMVIENKDHDL